MYLPPPPSLLTNRLLLSLYVVVPCRVHDFTVQIVELLLEKDWLEAPDHLLSKSEAANQAMVAAAQFGHKHVSVIIY